MRKISLFFLLKTVLGGLTVAIQGSGVGLSPKRIAPVPLQDKFMATPMRIRRSTYSIKQESCAIAKMTAQCALYMGAQKIFGTP